MIPKSEMLAEYNKAVTVLLEDERWKTHYTAMASRQEPTQKPSASASTETNAYSVFALPHIVRSMYVVSDAPQISPHSDDYMGQSITLHVYDDRDQRCASSIRRARSPLGAHRTTRRFRRFSSRNSGWGHCIWGILPLPTSVGPLSLYGDRLLYLCLCLPYLDKFNETIRKPCWSILQAKDQMRILYLIRPMAYLQ